MLSELHLCCFLNSKIRRSVRRAEPTSVFVPRCKLNPLWIRTHLLTHLSGTNLTLLARTCFMRLGRQRAVLAHRPDHVRFTASLLTDSQDRNERGRGSTFRRKAGQAPVSTGRLSWVGIQTPLITTSLILGESLNLSKTQLPDL